MIELVGYCVLRAVICYHTHPPEIDASAGLTTSAVDALGNAPARYERVVARYLTAAISLGRAAKLLNLPWLDLRACFQRLDVPLCTAPGTLEEARAGAEAALDWATACPSRV